VKPLAGLHTRGGHDNRCSRNRLSIWRKCERTGGWEPKADASHSRERARRKRIPVHVELWRGLPEFGVNAKNTQKRQNCRSGHRVGGSGRGTSKHRKIRSRGQKIAGVQSVGLFKENRRSDCNGNMASAERRLSRIGAFRASTRHSEYPEGAEARSRTLRFVVGAKQEAEFRGRKRKRNQRR